MTYSPRVPVFRNSDETLVRTQQEVRLGSFVSCAAPNRRAVTKCHEEEVKLVLENRMDRVLAVMTLHQHTAIVLGAFGCGVFGNDAAQVASIFRRLLTSKYKNCFEHVVFAIYAPEKNSKAKKNLEAFKLEFADLLDAS